MNKILFLLVLMTSTTVFACPNLAGEYECYDEEQGQYISTITQTGSGTSTVYTSTEFGETSIIKADNKWKVIDGLKTKAFCNGQTLNINMEGSDPNMGSFKASVKISIDSNNEIITEGSMTIGGQTYPAETESCRRL